jgi:tRNA(fMet)-specific endonuclease VapC
MSDFLLCDTCVIIDYMSGRNQALNDLLHNDVTLFVNSIIEMELLQGARDKNELQRKDFRFLPAIQFPDEY